MDNHKRERPIDDPLKLDLGFRLETPDWFQKSPGKASASVVRRQITAPPAKKITNKAVPMDNADQIGL